MIDLLITLLACVFFGFGTCVGVLSAVSAAVHPGTVSNHIDFWAGCFGFTVAAIASNWI